MKKILILGFCKHLDYYIKKFNEFEVHVFTDDVKLNKYNIDISNENIEMSNVVIVFSEKIFNIVKDRIINSDIIKFIFFQNQSTNFLSHKNNIHVYKSISIQHITSVLIKNGLFKEQITTNRQLNNSQPSIAPNAAGLKPFSKMESIKQEYRTFCKNELQSICELELPIIQQNRLNEAVIVETRELEHFEIIVRNCIYKLGEEWSHTIICGKNNYNFISNMVSKINRDIKIIKLPKTTISQNDYNNMLLSIDFWNLCVGEKILIYQEDSFIFKHNIMDFINWDYIGAPFKFNCVDGINVGNGGLSLRSKSKMIQVLQNTLVDSFNVHELKPFVRDFMARQRLDRVPEDIYFSTCLQKMHIGIVADFETAKQFSSETVYFEDSFGMHCMWRGCRDWKDKMINYCKNIKFTQPILSAQNHKSTSKTTNCYKTTSLIFSNKQHVYKNLEVLFHKYNLNISNKNDDIFYNIVNQKEITNLFICHFHIFDLNTVDENLLNYINLVKKEFDIIITFCKGDFQFDVYYGITMLQVMNRGYDIGGKLACLEYCKKENINFNYILFLHSKSNLQQRKKYFEPLIKNTMRLKLIKTLIQENNMYAIFPDSIWYNDDNDKNFTDANDAYIYNIKYYEDMLNYLNIKKYNVFAEGNCFLCNKNLLDFVFSENYKLFYNLLNYENTFDVNWFRNYYNCNNLSIEECYNKFINEKLNGNNIPIHYTDLSLPDGMIEHLFERIWITAIKHLDKNYIVLNSNNIVDTYKIKVNAIYFPQFHEIPENNKFWSEGFTEWTLLKPFDDKIEVRKKSKKILKPHSDIGYYDLGVENTLINQIKIAKNYNINGFVIYHYWFDYNHKVMYKPLERFLDNNITFPFCISWANETWSRRWDGSNNEVLLSQSYENHSFEDHINYLIQFFKMPNYMRTEQNECIFYIYNCCNNFLKIYEKMMLCWNEILEMNNLKIKIIITENSFNYTHTVKTIKNKFMFEPMYSSNYVRLFENYNFNKNNFDTDKFDVEFYKNTNTDLCKLSNEQLFTHFINYGINECRQFKYNGYIFNKNMCVDYTKLINNYKKNKYLTNDKHLGLPLDWNNVVRRKDKPFLWVDNFSSENVETLLILLLSKIIIRSSNTYKVQDFDTYDNVINVNAWNEWNEQAVLEPNNITGYSNLETISNVIKNV